MVSLLPQSTTTCDLEKRFVSTKSTFQEIQKINSLSTIIVGESHCYVESGFFARRQISVRVQEKIDEDPILKKITLGIPPIEDDQNLLMSLAFRTTAYVCSDRCWPSTILDNSDESHDYHVTHPQSISYSLKTISLLDRAQYLEAIDIISGTAIQLIFRRNGSHLYFGTGELGGMSITTPADLNSDNITPELDKIFNICKQFIKAYNEILQKNKDFIEAMENTEVQNIFPELDRNLNLKPLQDLVWEYVGLNGQYMWEMYHKVVSISAKP